MSWFIVLGGLLGVGLVQLWRLALPPRPNLAAQIARYDQAVIRANRRDQDVASDRFVRWALEMVGRRGYDLRSMKQDLEITETPLEDHMTKLLGLGISGFAGGAFIGIVWPRIVHIHVTPLLALFAGGALAGIAVWATSNDLHSKAEQRRAEMRQALSSWLDLVAMALEGGSGHAEALPTAAMVGSGWAFTLLQEATVNAPRDLGIAASTALGRLGGSIGMKELSELEGILALAQRDGNKVKQTLIARATTLRDARNTDSQAAAEKRTESMNYTLYILVFAFLAFEFYPPISRIMGS